MYSPKLQIPTANTAQICIRPFHFRNIFAAQTTALSLVQTDHFKPPCCSVSKRGRIKLKSLQECYEGNWSPRSRPGDEVVDFVQKQTHSCWTSSYLLSLAHVCSYPYQKPLRWTVQPNWFPISELATDKGTGRNALKSDYDDNNRRRTSISHRFPIRFWSSSSQSIPPRRIRLPTS